MTDEERKAWEEGRDSFRKWADTYKEYHARRASAKGGPIGAFIWADAELKRLRENNDSLMGRICELMHREEELEATFAHHHAALYDGEKLSDFCRYCGLDIRDDVHSELMRNAKAELRKAKEGR